MSALKLPRPSRLLTAVISKEHHSRDETTSTMDDLEAGCGEDAWVFCSLFKLVLDDLKKCFLFDRQTYQVNRVPVTLIG